MQQMARGGEGFLAIADDCWRGWVWNPRKLADIICEQHLMNNEMKIIWATYVSSKQCFSGFQIFHRMGGRGCSVTFYFDLKRLLLWWKYGDIKLTFLAVEIQGQFLWHFLLHFFGIEQKLISLSLFECSPVHSLLSWCILEKSCIFLAPCISLSLFGVDR